MSRAGPRGRSSAAAGFTLIELMVVMAIGVLLIGGALIGLRALGRTELRSAAGQLAAAIRYTFDRAITTGRTYRLVVDLDGHAYWVEEATDRFLLPRGKERARRGRRGARTDADEDEREEPAAGALDDPAAPFVRPRPRFEAVKDGHLGRHALHKGITLPAFWAAHQEEPFVEGKGYLYFFPQGQTERAIVQLAQGDDAVYSLLVSPLDGRVEVAARRVEPPARGPRDDAGEAVPE